jgi:hypothetical protein
MSVRGEFIAFARTKELGSTIMNSDPRGAMNSDLKQIVFSPMGMFVATIIALGTLVLILSLFGG